MIKIIVVVIFSYLLGNFSTSLIVSKLWADIDIRKHGSGNAGATNVLRTLGLKAGLITFLGDALKGAISVFIAGKLGGENLALLAGTAVVIGHNWPIIFGFKGGKGIATTIGVVLMIYPLAALICILVGVLVVIKTKYISLGSLIAICLLPILLIFSGIKLFLFGVSMAAMAIVRHRTNIKRLMEGTESKISKKTGIK